MPVVSKTPNQKQVTVKKEKCDKTHIYAMVNKDAMFQAMNKFSGRKAPSFLLWMYIASNQQDYTFALSPKAIENEIGLKEDAYRTAVKNLEDENYLVLVKNNTYYEFHEIPFSQELK